jgi:hypothetical protein
MRLTSANALDLAGRSSAIASMDSRSSAAVISEIDGRRHRRWTNAPVRNKLDRVWSSRVIAVGAAIAPVHRLFPPFSHCRECFRLLVSPILGRQTRAEVPITGARD